MRLFLYSLNYAPELTGIGKYNGEMVPEILENGHDVHVVCAPPYYPEWEVKQGYRSNSYVTEKLNDVTVHRCPLFVPKEVTTLKRLLHLVSFAITSGFKLITLLKEKPDVVVLVQPTLFCAPFTLIYCKLSGATSVMHIQDYELDAMLGLGMGGGRITRALKHIESWLMNKFDVVSSISFSMLENAKRKGVSEDKLMFFPNWADVDFVTPETDGSAFKQSLGFSDEHKIVLYAGNMGKKQGLEIVLQAAAALHNIEPLRFVMVGDGAHVSELKKMAEALNLSNIVFLPLQPWEKVPEMLAMADIHLVIQRKGAADAVLPSKLTNILAAGGHAIVTAEPETELGKLADKFPGIYSCIEPESEGALVKAIQSQIVAIQSEYNKVAREYAEQHLNKSEIIERFLHDINNKLELAVQAH